MIVQQNLTAGVNAVEVRTALCTCLLIDPARFTRIAHLLQVPVQLLAGGLMGVENRVVAHLAVRDRLVDLPAVANLLVQVALCLDAGRVVLIDEANLRGTAHAARNHVLTDDICDIQQVDGLELGAGLAVTRTGLTDDLVNLIDHAHHGLVARCRAAEHLELFALGTDIAVIDHDMTDLVVLVVVEQVKVRVERLCPALLGVTDGDVSGVAREGEVGVFQTLVLGHFLIHLVQKL